MVEPSAREARGAAVASRQRESAARQEQLERWLARPRSAGIRAQGLLSHGDAVGQILIQAEQRAADVIVMGRHEERDSPGWALGAVAAGVLRRAVRPVLTVPALAGLPKASLRLRRILCPVDFSEPCSSSLEYARLLARTFEARLLLLHVLEWFPEQGPAPTVFGVPEYHLDLCGEARHRMRQLAPGSEVEQEELVALGHPHRQILRVAREHEADLIALGVHSRRDLDRVLPGGTMTHVLREAECPILAVPPPSRVEPRPGSFAA